MNAELKCEWKKTISYHNDPSQIFIERNSLISLFRLEPFFIFLRRANYLFPSKVYFVLLFFLDLLICSRYLLLISRCFRRKLWILWFATRILSNSRTNQLRSDVFTIFKHCKVLRMLSMILVLFWKKLWKSWWRIKFFFSRKYRHCRYVDCAFFRYHIRDPSIRERAIIFLSSTKFPCIKHNSW